MVPQAVEVRYRTEGGGRGRATMDRRGVARGPEDHFQEYAYTFRSVLADIHFDVAGGDDRVADRQIQVVDSPTISQMTLDCELPAYIGRKAAAAARQRRDADSDGQPRDGPGRRRPTRIWSRCK